MDEVPREVLDAAGLSDAVVTLLPWQRPIWRVDHRQCSLVLRQRELGSLCEPADLLWQHRLQDSLAEMGVPVPRPARCFAGDSMFAHAGRLWELSTFLPGRAYGWSPRPPLQDFGRFMAEVHNALAGTSVPDQRPLAVPLRVLLDHVRWPTLEASFTDVSARNRAREHIEAAAAWAPERTSEAPGVVHGDFTGLNVLVDGNPPQISGLIDFENSYVETTVADIGFSLWQIARPAHQDWRWTSQRVSDLVSGYTQVRPLTAMTAATVVGYAHARGAQILVRASRRGPRDLSGALAMLDWITRHRPAITDALTSNNSDDREERGSSPAGALAAE